MKHIITDLAFLMHNYNKVFEICSLEKDLHILAGV